jgi:hypothetical protein
VQDIHRHNATEGRDSTVSDSSFIATAIKKAVGFGMEHNSVNEVGKSKETGTNFDQITESSTSYDGINVSMYKSRKTGLKVLIADVQVPIVSFHFCLVC